MRQISKIEHEWDGHLETFSRTQVIENSSQYFSLRTDVLQKTVVGAPVPFYHPKNNFEYEQMTSNPAFTERNTQKANAYLLHYILVRSKNLWSRITLYRACTYVFGLSTL